MLLLPLLIAAAVGLPIQLSRRTIDTSAVLRRAEPPRFERGVFVVQFRSAIDDTILRRLQAVLGYAPTEYVPTNALILFVNSTETGDRLTSALGTRIKHFERLQHNDRRDDIASAVDAMRARPGNGELRASRKGAKQPPPVEDLRQVRLRVRSFYGSQRQHADDVDRATNYVAQLSNSMSGLSRRPQPRVDDSAQHITVENVDADEAELASEAILDGLDDVYWVEVIPPYELLNYWSVPAIHRAQDAEKAKAPAVAQTSSWQPLLGLRGTNQTIGLSDTGIAYNCFFSDGLGAAAGTFPTVTGLNSVPSDTRHRKIRAYSTGSGGDLRDSGATAGHGTHVAGTLIGRAANGSSSAKYNGGAPNARVAFIDLMQSDTNAQYLYVPDMTSMLQWFYDAGARIKSGSWGSNNNGRYTIDDRDIDAFTWQRREMLVVFAAGNLGTEGSISTPAMNKNGLTVGATMNGYEAYALAATPPRTFAQTTPEYLAAFSSRGSSMLPFAKPDVCASGGQYVWSADNDAPESGSCADEVKTTTGYAGTSMATPLVAATAALLYEALQTGKVEIPESAGALPVRASLVRAMLAASGRPLKGIFPATSYASTTVRRNAEGNGRIALDRIIGPTVALAILSNERAEHGLTRVGSSIRACVDISGLARGATLAGFELVVQLAYADYPSSVVGAASIVNNLDLRVTPIGSSTPFSVNYGAVNASETRSTLERVIVPLARAVDIEVRLTQLGFGPVQTFSLIAALRAISPSSVPIARTLIVSPLAVGTGACTVCSDGALKIASQCARCGDGVVGTGEQCESGECCDTTTCRWKSSGDCSVDIGTCTVSGRCASNNGTCLVTQSVMSGSECRASDGDGACTKTANWWLASIRASGLPFGLAATNSSELRICCQQFARFAHDSAPADPLYHALATNYIAARLNYATPNVSTSAAVLNAMRAAKTLLEARCGLFDLAFSGDATSAKTLIAALVAYNEPPCASKQQADDEPWCEASIAAPNALCSGVPNRYNADDATCTCGEARQEEPDCRHLACSGRGVSIYDSVMGQDKCVCLPGWTGSSCSHCVESTVPNTRFMCLGTSLAAQKAGSPAYLLRAVASGSTNGRLSGTFYTTLLKKLGKAAIAKTTDALPGSGVLDCWCETNRPSASAFASHLEAIQNATATQLAQMQWEAVYDNDFGIATTGVRTASAFKVGASSTRVGASLSVLTVWLASILR